MGDAAELRVVVVDGGGPAPGSPSAPPVQRQNVAPPAAPSTPAQRIPRLTPQTKDDPASSLGQLLNQIISKTEVGRVAQNVHKSVTDVVKNIPGFQARAASAAPSAATSRAMLPAPAAGAAAGGAMSGLAAAAIPIALGVAAAVAANWVIGRAGQAARGAIQGASNMAQAVAKGDAVGNAVGLVEKTADVFSKVVSVVPVAGKMLGELAKTGATAVRAVDDVAKAFLARAAELVIYSPQIAAAQGRQEMREIRMGLREGQALGGKYAQLQDSYGKLEERVSTALLGIKSVLLDLLNKILEKINDFLDWLPSFSDIVKASRDASLNIQSWLEEAFPLFKAQLQLIGADAETMRKLMVKKDAEANKALPDPLQQFFDLLLPDNTPNFHPNGVNNGRKQAENRLKIPAFAGL